MKLEQKVERLRNFSPLHALSSGCRLDCGTLIYGSSHQTPGRVLTRHSVPGVESLLAKVVETVANR